MIKSRFAIMAAASVAAAMLLLSGNVNTAWAHASANLNLPTDVTRGVRLTIGETAEPAYVDSPHNIDIAIRDRLTGLPVGNAHKKLDGTQGLKVDAYFYPKGVTPSVTGTEPAALAAGPGFTDSKLNQNVRTIFGKLGSYQADDQFYSKTGITLYRVYGVINYYGDAEIPVDVWIDGGAVKRGVSGATTVTWSGGFGLQDATTKYWPDADGGATATTHPDNIREAIGTIKADVAQLKADVASTKTNTVDIYNFLRAIAQGINQLLTSGTPITIPAAK
jgi:hypothetical protein